MLSEAMHREGTGDTHTPRIFCSLATPVHGDIFLCRPGMHVRSMALCLFFDRID